VYHQVNLSSELTKMLASLGLKKKKKAPEQSLWQLYEAPTHQHQYYIEDNIIRATLCKR
jgi:hypothetical protein